MTRYFNLKEIMNFNLKYLILPMSIFICINNNYVNAMENTNNNIEIDVNADKISFWEIKQIFEQNFDKKKILDVRSSRNSNFNIPKLKNFMAKLAQTAEDVVNNNEMHKLNVQDFITTKYIEGRRNEYILNNNNFTDDYMMDWKQILSYYLAYYYEIVNNIRWHPNPDFLKISGYNSFTEQQYNAILKLLLYTTVNVRFKCILNTNFTFDHIKEVINNNTLYEYNTNNEEDYNKLSYPVNAMNYAIEKLRESIVNKDKYNPKLEDLDENGFIKVEKRLKNNFDILFLEIKPIMIDCFAHALYSNMNKTSDENKNKTLFQEINNILCNDYNTKKYILYKNMQPMCDYFRKKISKFYRQNKTKIPNYDKELHDIRTMPKPLFDVFKDINNNAKENELIKYYCKMIAKDIDFLIHNEIETPKEYGITSNIYRDCILFFDYFIGCFRASIAFNPYIINGKAWNFIEKYIIPMVKQGDITSRQYQSLLEYCLNYIFTAPGYPKQSDNILKQYDNLLKQYSNILVFINNIIKELSYVFLTTQQDVIFKYIYDDMLKGKKQQDSSLIDIISNQIIKRILYWIDVSKETSFYEYNIIYYLFNGSEINEKTVDEKFNVTKIVKEQFKNNTEYSKYYSKYKKRFDLNTYINVFRRYDKIAGNKKHKTIVYDKNYNNKELKQIAEQRYKSPLGDTPLNTMFHFLMNQIQVINALSTYIQKINCNNNYNVHIFSQYIYNIIEYYNTKFKQLIQTILNEELSNNPIITSHIYRLTSILENIDINRNTTIEDLINKEKQLTRQIKLLEDINYNKEFLNKLIDSVNLLTDFIDKINKQESNIMKLTLQDLIDRNQNQNVGRKIKRIPIQEEAKSNSFLDKID